MERSQRRQLTYVFVHILRDKFHSIELLNPPCPLKTSRMKPTFLFVWFCLVCFSSFFVSIRSTTYRGKRMSLHVCTLYTLPSLPHRRGWRYEDLLRHTYFRICMDLYVYIYIKKQLLVFLYLLSVSRSRSFNLVYRWRIHIHKNL